MNRAVPRSPSIVMWLVLPLFCQGGGTAAGSQLPCGEVCCFHFPAVPTLGKLLISLCLDCFLCKMETIVPTSKGWGRDEIMKCVDLVLTMNLKSRWYLFLLSEYGNWIFFPFALLISTLSCLETSSFVCLSSRTPRAFKICCYSCLCPCPTFSTRFWASWGQATSVMFVFSFCTKHWLVNWLNEWLGRWAGLQRTGIGGRSGAKWKN